jgi:dihydroorotate dehydrogenase (NAD+) catalytic subunit
MMDRFSTWMRWSGESIMQALLLSTGKRDLVINPPLINAAGSLGYSDEARRLIDLTQLGAFITNPVSMRPRKPAQGPRWLSFAGGFLLHTGHPNPGLSEVVRRHRKRWATTSCPVVVHALTRLPHEAGQIAERLEEVEGVCGIELNLSEASPREAAALVSSATEAHLPILAHLPIGVDEEVALAAIQAGAVALTLGPPRGTMHTPEGGLITGRLYGRSIFPLALQSLIRLVDCVDRPVLGGGGIYTREHVDIMIAAGAAGVQLDAVMWTEPEVVLDTN